MLSDIPTFKYISTVVPNWAPHSPPPPGGVPESAVFSHQDHVAGSVLDDSKQAQDDCDDVKEVDHDGGPLVAQEIEHLPLQGSYLQGQKQGEEISFFFFLFWFVGNWRPSFSVLSWGVNRRGGDQGGRVGIKGGAEQSGSDPLLWRLLRWAVTVFPINLRLSLVFTKRYFL